MNRANSSRGQRFDGVILDMRVYIGQPPSGSWRCGWHMSRKYRPLFSSDTSCREIQRPRPVGDYPDFDNRLREHLGELTGQRAARHPERTLFRIPRACTSSGTRIRPFSYALRSSSSPVHLIRLASRPFIPACRKAHAHSTAPSQTTSRQGPRKQWNTFKRTSPHCAVRSNIFVFPKQTILVHQHADAGVGAPDHGDAVFDAPEPCHGRVVIRTGRSAEPPVIGDVTIRLAVVSSRSRTNAG